MTARVLGVVYDSGSVPPVRLAQMATRIGCDLLFICAPTDHAKAMLLLLGAYGRTTTVERFRHQPVPIDGIVTFSEAQLPVAVELALLARVPYLSPAVAAGFYNKLSQRETLAKARVDSIAFAPVGSLAEAAAVLDRFPLPFVAKPAISSSSRNTFKVVDRAQGWREFERIFAGAERGLVGPLIVEEMLQGRPTQAPWGDYIGIDCLARNGVVQPLMVTGKFSLAAPFRERGGFAPSNLDPAELAELTTLACRAVTALGMTEGVAGVEIKLTGDGPRIIEVNGRLGGWVDALAEVTAGFSPAEYAMRCALGMATEPIAQPAADGPVAFDYVVIPPQDATALVDAADLRQLKVLPGVRRISVHRKPGEHLQWWRGVAGSSVANISGLVSDHAQLAALVSRIETLEAFHYSYEDPTGVCSA